MKARRKGLGRRSFLAGIGGSAAIVPFLPLPQSVAEVGDVPRRLVVFCTPNANGFYPNGFSPSGNETDFTLSQILMPFGGGDTVHGQLIGNLKNDIVVLEGIDLEASYDGPSPGAHLVGQNSVLTGRPLMPGNLFDGGGSETSGWGSGISIDQFVADAIGQDTAFSSLELGVHNFGGVSDIRFVMSYKGEAAPLPVESDPYVAFDRVFGDFVAEDPAELVRIRHERQSVIDFVKADLEAAKGKIGAADVHKLDAHLEGVRSIEQRLTGELGDACVIPDQGNAIDPEQQANDEIVAKLQMDMLVAAMACGVTNVGSILWGGATNAGKFGFVPGVSGSDSLHSLTHRDDQAAKDEVKLIANWYMKQLAYFAQRLKDIPEGDGTMLDNTLIVWCSETSVASAHNRRNMPFVLVGQGGGGLQTGRWLQYDGVVHNKLLVSIARIMGLEIDQFGGNAYGTGGLNGIA
jgi:hypothetical protein